MKTNEQIRMAAQSIFRTLVSATYNDKYGEDDGTMNISLGRMLKAAEWAKANGEYDTLKSVCGQMFSAAGPDMRMAADEVFETIFCMNI